jgi:hypothetical protein
MNDPIVEEVRRIRAQIAAEHNHDLHRIFEDARSRQGAGGRCVVSFDQVKDDAPSSIVREEPPKP